MKDMALVVFLRGVNVGGHRRFRPSLLAKELSRFETVSIGAAGTLVVRRPGSRTKFRAELARRLPFETEIALCDGRELLELASTNPFRTEQAHPDVVRFVSILSKSGRCTAAIPLALPAEGGWFVRVIASQARFVCGVYRRQMKTIGYLNQLDRLFGAPATTRNWNTILEVVRVLRTPTSHHRPGAPRLGREQS
jgi:uncharacterized protein (DUF1697 family)